MVQFIGTLVVAAGVGYTLAWFIFSGFDRKKK